MAEVVAIAFREKSRAPMHEVETAEVSLEAGVAGDLRGRPGPRQVTVLAEEAWQAACRALGERLPWVLRRANVLVRGLDLEETTGSRLVLGDVVLEISGETDPCRVMDLQHEGLREALVPAWRGGVSCRVLSSGTLRVGDAARLESSEPGA